MVRGQPPRGTQALESCKWSRDGFRYLRAMACTILLWSRLAVSLQRTSVWHPHFYPSAYPAVPGLVWLDTGSQGCLGRRSGTDRSCDRAERSRRLRTSSLLRQSTLTLQASWSSRPPDSTPSPTLPHRSRHLPMTLRCHRNYHPVTSECRLKS